MRWDLASFHIMASSRAWHESYRKSAHGKRVRFRARFASDLKTRYGLDVEDIARAYDAQNQKCAVLVCGKRLTLGRDTAIDHCHRTGKFRGLLCLGCNTSLGHVRDSVPHLLSLADYLEGRR